MTEPERKELAWEQVQQRFTCPAWFAEARFGVWVHWGAQTQPAEGGGWYGRHMY
ncbi:alpha-L-fucosidase, partial [Kribbella catacumbae]|uniref:alpha-L-fucosidase n=1 Tax=Kribbella catacumbae TaxID=460086 RepID=UPI00146A5F7E